MQRAPCISDAHTELLSLLAAPTHSSNCNRSMCARAGLHLSAFFMGELSQMGSLCAHAASDSWNRGMTQGITTQYIWLVPLHGCVTRLSQMYIGGEPTLKSTSLLGAARRETALWVPPHSTSNSRKERGAFHHFSLAPHVSFLEHVQEAPSALSQHQANKHFLRWVSLKSGHTPVTQHVWAYCVAWPSDC